MSDLLTVLVCGSVDDGKSTLMGRLFAESGAVPADELAELPILDGAPDTAAWFDGLGDEREQGITIDFATRQLTLGGRRLRVLDAPGHEQYCRNMFTAASNADAALLLVDAGKGPSAQTFRHARLAALAGVKHFAIMATKMDAIDWDQDSFERVASDLCERLAPVIGDDVTAIPVSGLTGANVIKRDMVPDWVTGPTLADWLGDVELPSIDKSSALRMPVQWVRKDGKNARWLAGPRLSGAINKGDRITIVPSGTAVTVAECRAHGDALMVRLEEDVDCGRGDILTDDSGLETADQFEAMLTWFSDTAQVPGRRYRLKLGTADVSIRLRKPKYRLDMESGDQMAAKRLERNDIGVAELVVLKPLSYACFGKGDPAARELGSFVLVDPTSGETVAAGTINHPLRRADNIHRAPLIVDPARRAELMGQTPAILWFTGLSGAGKSTLANKVEEELARRGRHSFLLDGDNLRLGLNKDLGFTDADRIENIRRVSAVAKLMADAGLIVLTAFISPFRADRMLARDVAGAHLFYEIFVDTPLDIAEERDPKGLYAKARAGQLQNFTGIDSPYQAPENPDLHLASGEQDVEALVKQVISQLEQDGIV